jgi:hypothetical protein
MDDEATSFYFDIPATDALGRLNVTGKLRAVADKVELHWKEKDRTFTRSKNQLRTVELDYGEIEEASIKGSWFQKKYLVLRVTDPRLIEEMPGVKMGTVELELPKKSLADAKKFVSMLEYRVSEKAAQRADDRLREFNID